MNVPPCLCKAGRPLISIILRRDTRAVLKLTRTTCLSNLNLLHLAVLELSAQRHADEQGFGDVTTFTLDLMTSERHDIGDGLQFCMGICFF